MSLVQAVGFFNDQTSATVNVPLAPTGANALILMLANYIDTKHVTSFVAGAASSSTPDFTYSDTGDNFFLQFFSLPSIASGLTSAAVNMSASGFLAGIVVEESGLATSAAFDKSSPGYQTGAVSWTSGNTGTTSQASEIAYGICFVPAVVAGSTYGTLGSGWSALSGSGLTAGVSSEATAGLSILGARRALSSAGAYAFNGGVGNTAANDTYAALIGTYKTATGGGGSTVSPSGGSAAISANAPNLVAGTVIQVPQAFRRPLAVPNRRIILPPWRKAA